MLDLVFIYITFIIIITIVIVIYLDINVCAQDVAYNEKFGAYTGELSASLLVDSGIKWTLTGHSERRVGFGGQGESSKQVAIKTKNALAANMSVILCIGEMLSDRESGKTMDVCIEQLSACTAVLTPEEWKRVVIAYEPVWAIGTGKVATPAQAEETHFHIRQWIEKSVSSKVASEIRIIYGGSVKGSNCAELITCPNIDGFLVGGASLLPEFVDIIKVKYYTI
jgi:triosephosphate isomerase